MNYTPSFYEHYTTVCEYAIFHLRPFMNTYTPFCEVIFSHFYKLEWEIYFAQHTFSSTFIQLRPIMIVITTFCESIYD